VRKPIHLLPGIVANNLNISEKDLNSFRMMLPEDISSFVSEGTTYLILGAQLEN
jgi:hypothetical protein